MLYLQRGQLAQSSLHVPEKLSGVTSERYYILLAVETLDSQEEFTQDIFKMRSLIKFVARLQPMHPVQRVLFSGPNAQGNPAENKTFNQAEFLAATVTKQSTQYECVFEPVSQIDPKRKAAFTNRLLALIKEHAVVKESEFPPQGTELSLHNMCYGLAITQWQPVHVEAVITMLTDDKTSDITDLFTKDMGPDALKPCIAMLKKPELQSILQFINYCKTRTTFETNTLPLHLFVHWFFQYYIRTREHSPFAAEQQELNNGLYSLQAIMQDPQIELAKKKTQDLMNHALERQRSFIVPLATQTRIHRQSIIRVVDEDVQVEGERTFEGRPASKFHAVDKGKKLKGKHTLDETEVLKQNIGKQPSAQSILASLIENMRSMRLSHQ